MTLRMYFPDLCEVIVMILLNNAEYERSFIGQLSYMRK